MYTQGSSQQTFEIPNDNLDVNLDSSHMSASEPYVYTHPVHQNYYDLSPS